MPQVQTLEIIGTDTIETDYFEDGTTEWWEHVVLEIQRAKMGRPTWFCPRVEFRYQGIRTTLATIESGTYLDTEENK